MRWLRFWNSVWRYLAWELYSVITAVAGFIGGIALLMWVFGDQEQKTPGWASRLFKDLNK